MQRVISRNLIISILCSYRLVLSSVWTTDTMGIIDLEVFFLGVLCSGCCPPANWTCVSWMTGICSLKHVFKVKKIRYLVGNKFTFYGKTEIIIVGLHCNTVFMLCLQARIFNETPINPRRCLHILTKILYLLNQVTLTNSSQPEWTFLTLISENFQCERHFIPLPIRLGRQLLKR